MHAPSAGVGRRSDLAAELAELGEPSYTAARVLAQHRGRWLVADGSDAPPRLVAARGRMRAATELTPSTGDWVALDADGVIAAVLERRGVVVRRAAGSPVAGQLLAANVELVLVVEPLPEPNERRAERIVALATSGGVHAALVLTKADLDPIGAAAARATATGLGLADGIAVSVHDPDSIAPLDALLEPGTRSPRKKGRRLRARSPWQIRRTKPKNSPSSSKNTLRENSPANSIPEASAPEPKSPSSDPTEPVSAAKNGKDP